MSTNYRPYENLAAAIVLAAVSDYRSALKRLKRMPEDPKAREKRLEIEEFFFSEEFRILSNLEPEMLAGRLSGEVYP